MFKIKDWCAVAVSRGFSAVQGFVHGGSGGNHKQSVHHAGAEVVINKQELVKTSDSTAEKAQNIDEHICIQCRVPSFRCVALNGSNVDLKQPDSIQRTETFDKVDVSTQTTMSSAQHSINLPDLLNPANSLDSQLVTGLSTPPPILLPICSLPPPPPPPPPPLPPLLKSAPAERNMCKKKTVKKRKSGGSSVIPEITEEALRKVKLKKPEERVLRSQSSIDENSPKTFAHPVVTMETLQRVSLRKASAPQKAGHSPHRRRSGTKENFGSGAGEVIDVKQFLKRTRLDRSPGGTPLPSKRIRHPGESGTPEQKTTKEK